MHVTVELVLVLFLIWTPNSLKSEKSNVRKTVTEPHTTAATPHSTDARHHVESITPTTQPAKASRTENPATATTTATSNLTGLRRNDNSKTVTPVTAGSNNNSTIHTSPTPQLVTNLTTPTKAENVPSQGAFSNETFTSSPQTRDEVTTESDASDLFSTPTSLDDLLTTETPFPCGVLTATRRVQTGCRPCYITRSLGCPPGSELIEEQECGASRSWCSLICQTTIRHPKCCPGRWGADCQVCPGAELLGSAINNSALANQSAEVEVNSTLDAPQPSVLGVCSGHGVCSEGLEGNGTCACSDGFSGFACELCSRSDVFGPECNNSCQCVNGDCDSGATGTGRCDCWTGYEGPSCDELSKCNASRCGENAHCVSTHGQACACDAGYTGDGINCSEVDLCAVGLSPCARIGAQCTMLAPNNASCSCRTGYRGDGFVCTPIDPCQDHPPPCPSNSTQCTYLWPGQHTCQCLRGFVNYTEGLGCTMLDLCQSDPCHRYAECTMHGPNRYDCECLEGFVGDGKTCRGNILQTLHDLNQNDPKLKNKLGKSIRLFTFTMGDVLNISGRISDDWTVFAPLDSGYSGDLKFRSADWFVALQTAKTHVLPIARSMPDLVRSTRIYFLEGTRGLFYARRNVYKYRVAGQRTRTNIVRRDLLTTNGFVNIVDRAIKKPPVIGYKRRQTLLTQIEADGRYNRLQSLCAAAGLSELLNDTISGKNLTLFAPNNIAWDALSEDTLNYLQQPTGLPKLVALIKNHIVLGEALSYKARQAAHLPTLADHQLSLSFSETTGRLLVNEKAQVWQTDIPAANGIFHHVNAVLIPESIDPIIERHCGEEQTPRLVDGVCVSIADCSNTSLRCHEKTDRIRLDLPISSCPLDGDRLSRLWFPRRFRGCSAKCERNVTQKACCENFYGPNCRSCPGGHLNPCFGRGDCLDGVTGSGKCACYANFTGSVCQFCSDQNKFGEGCNQTCTCLHGNCNNRADGTGTGHCYPGTCDWGTTGEDCQLNVRLCGNTTACHVNAVCVDRYDSPDAEPECFCKDGFRGDGVTCQLINPCEEVAYGGCHRQAECTYVRPGQNTCRCRPGWVGDGQYCYPSTVCNDAHSVCHENALCEPTTPGRYECVCRAAFHGNGTHCVRINVCDFDNGGCFPLGSCVPLGPGKRNCSCPSGYIGNGVTCIGSLWHELSTLNQIGNFQADAVNVQRVLSNLSQQFTVFAPNDSSIESSRGEAIDAWLWRYHVVRGRHSLADMGRLVRGHATSGSVFLPTLANANGRPLKVNVSFSAGILHINTARVVAGDLPAVNGFIHIIDRSLQPIRPSGSLAALFATHTRFSRFGAALQETGHMQALERLDSYTLLVLDNAHWRSTWRGEKLRRYLSYYSLRNKISLTALASLHQIETLFSQGPSGKLNITTGGGNVFVNGYVLHDDHLHTTQGAVYRVSHALTPNLNRCDVPSSYGVYRAECCPAHYGFDCRPCPGLDYEHDNTSLPCSGHGACEAHITGSGACTCAEGFTGRSCAQCADGYLAPDCRFDQCRLCSEHADCVNRGNKTHCRCRFGFTGDGMQCAPTCTVENGGCDPNANCSASTVNGDVACVCREWYYGDGRNCTRVADLCAAADRGGCDHNADCRFYLPELGGERGWVTCTCRTEYIGNGTYCNGDLRQTLRSMAVGDNLFVSINTADDGVITELDETLGGMLSNSSGRLTIFIPTNWSLDVSLNVTELVFERHLVDTYINLTRDLLDRNDTDYTALSGDRLTVGYDESRGVFTINDTDVLVVNIPAINGIIHIIQRPLQPPPSTSPVVARTKFTVNMIVLIVGVLVGVTLLVLVVAVCYIKRKHRPTFSTGCANADFKFFALDNNSDRLPVEACMDDSASTFRNPLYDNMDALGFTDEASW